VATPDGLTRGERALLLVRERPNLGISRVRLRRIMGAYANSQGYLTNTVEGAVRIGLDGQPAGAVTAGEAERAHGRLCREAGSREEKAAHAVANMQVEGPLASAQNPEETFPQPSGVLRDMPLLHYHRASRFHFHDAYLRIACTIRLHLKNVSLSYVIFLSNN
jgi:hypothetical protein